jgi:hypothetical protein
MYFTEVTEFFLTQRSQRFRKERRELIPPQKLRDLCATFALLALKTQFPNSSLPFFHH